MAEQIIFDAVFDDDLEIDFIEESDDIFEVDFPVDIVTISEADKMVLNETPSGAMDSDNVNYTVAFPYVAGTLCVYYNGNRLRPTTDYVETVDGFDTTFTIDSDSENNLLCDYIKS